MNRAELRAYLIISAGLLLSGCSNIESFKASDSQRTMSQETLNQKIVITPTQHDAMTAKQPFISVDWQNVEELAGQAYQNKSVEELLSHNDLNWEDSDPNDLSYAREFKVSVTEARRRLRLMSLSSKVMNAVEEDLGEASLMSYYINDDPNEFRVGVTTLNNVLAERYVYKFKHSGSVDYSLPIYIYPISDKTLVQINQLIADATPEILKRYPHTWVTHYDPVKNSVDIFISFPPSKLPNETERQLIEAELTSIIGYQVALKVNVATYSYRK